MTRVPLTLIACAVLRRDGQVLLVRQGGPAGPGTAWALPGGHSEPGETAIETVRREVFEETGLAVQDDGVLVAVAQLDNPTDHARDGGEAPGPRDTAIFLTFEFNSWSGKLPSGAVDPDDDVAKVRFWPLGVARELVAGHPFPFMATALTAALDAAVQGRGVSPLWYRRDSAGVDRPV